MPMDSGYHPKKIAPVRRHPRWTPGHTVEQAATKDDTKESAGDWYGVRVYTDGSAVDGGVGAAAVLLRPRSRRPRVLKMHLGTVDEHMVYEGEIVGTILGAELLRTERGTPWQPLIALDSTAALQASETTRTRPGHYLTDLFHDRLETAARARMRTCHALGGRAYGRAGNEMADDEAQEPPM